MVEEMVVTDRTVFISYAREDREVALQLYLDLKRRGAHPWLDKVDIPAGAKWKRSIADAIKTSSFFLTLLSKNSLLKTGFFQKELKEALEHFEERPHSDVYIIPVLLEDGVEPEEPTLKELHWVRLYESYEDGLTRILRVVAPRAVLTEEVTSAGIQAVYSDRMGYAEEALGNAFDNHKGGEVLLTGASLRLFLAPGLHFYSFIDRMLRRSTVEPVVVRALSCHPEMNSEIPVRSFVEEFNQDGTMPKSTEFDEDAPKVLSLVEFRKSYFRDYGLQGLVKASRVVHDLVSTRTGVEALRGAAATAGNVIKHREFVSAPYCTAVLFPDRAFYTPNILCTEVPANMPMIAFDSTSDAYRKICSYFEILWWLSS